MRWVLYENWYRFVGGGKARVTKSSEYFAGCMQLTRHREPSAEAGLIRKIGTDATAVGQQRSGTSAS